MNIRARTFGKLTIYVHDRGWHKTLSTEVDEMANEIELRCQNEKKTLFLTGIFAWPILNRPDNAENLREEYTPLLDTMNASDFIIVDHSLEGITFLHLSSFVSCLSSIGVLDATNRVIFVAMNDRVSNAEQPNNRLCRVCLYNGFWSYCRKNAIANRDRLEIAMTDRRLSARFLLLGGTPRPHKQAFFLHLFEKKILQSLMWSCGSVPDQRWPNAISFYHPSLKETTDVLQMSVGSAFSRLTPRKLDIDPSNKTVNLSTPFELFACSGISIVLETEIRPYSFRYTEKTLKAIAAAHPFIIWGNFGTLELLRKAGFQSFHPFINETYDTIENPSERLKAVVDEVERISTMDETEFGSLMQNLLSIAQRNLLYFIGNSFKDFQQRQLLRALTIAE